MSRDSEHPETPSSWLAEIHAQPPEREALIFEGEVSSFGEMADGVARLLADFDRNDLSPILAQGERIALFAPPSAAGVLLIHACLERGVVMVPWNLRWTDEECVFAARAAGTKWIVVSEQTEAAGDRIAASLGCGLLRLVESTGLAATIALVRHPAPDPVFDTERASETTRDADREWVLARRGALLLFTSGTSGRPKAALLSDRNLRASARASIQLLGRDADDRWLCCMPLFHIGGLSILVRSVLARTCVVLHRGFDAGAVSQALDHERVTRVSWVATMLSRVLDHRGDRPAPDSLRLVLLGGGPAPDSMLERARRLGYPLAPTYGLTEAASQVATRPPDAAVREGESLASGLVALPGTEIRIVDEAGMPLPADSPGAIEVRGPTVMPGYFRDRDATTSALRNGWLVTGDVGILDVRGGLQVLDRRSDLIVSGGENVYPAEVESVLAGYPGVSEAAVIGAPDPRFGACVRALVVPEAGAALEEPALLEFCRERLAGFKVPRSIDFVDALPRTASGKLLRRDLANRFR